jgi:hypothetical protein
VAARFAPEIVREACARRRLGAIAAWLPLAGLLASCASGRPSLVDSPLSIEQQQQAVLEIVPRGSSRAEAEKRLKAAGIDFRPGGKGSIYYLLLWNRPNGERWHIDVALSDERSAAATAPQVPDDERVPFPKR